MTLWPLVYIPCHKVHASPELYHLPVFAVHPKSPPCFFGESLRNTAPLHQSWLITFPPGTWPGPSSAVYLPLIPLDSPFLYSTGNIRNIPLYPWSPIPSSVLGNSTISHSPLTPMLLEYTDTALLIVTSPRFSASYEPRAFLRSSFPYRVCSFSFHFCSICIRARCRLQKVKCWIPDSTRKSSSLYSILSFPKLLQTVRNAWRSLPDGPLRFVFAPCPH